MTAISVSYLPLPKERLGFYFMDTIKDFFKKYPFLKHFFILIPPIFYFLTVYKTIGLADTAMMIDRMVDLNFSTHVNRHNLAMLFGHIFTKLPIGEMAYRCNLMVAFFGAVSSILFYFLIFRITKNYLITLLSSLIFMVSHSFWWHSTIAENYIINAFFIILILHCYVSFLKHKRLIFIYISFILAGLSLFNHVQNGVWLVSSAFFVILHFKEVTMESKSIIWGAIRKRLFKGSSNTLSSIITFIWVTIFSAINFIIGIFPYIYIFLEEVQRRGGNVQRVVDSASGGQFKNIMFNFESFNGLYQSFWYGHLQFPSIFYGFIILGALYYTFFALLFFIKPSREKYENKKKKALFHYIFLVAIGLCSLAFIFNFFSYVYNLKFNFAGNFYRWNHYTFASVLILIVIIASLFILAKLRRENFIEKPIKDKYFKLMLTLLAFPGLITIFFFAFFDTWDGFAFMLPVYIIGAVVGSVFLDKIIKVLKTKIYIKRELNEEKSRKKYSFAYWIIIALLVFGIVFPMWYYSQIGKWSSDPASWWFYYGPYRDRRFINTHSRVEYNYNPNKSNYKDIIEAIELILDKLPQDATLIDDDSRMYYPITMYYQEYVLPRKIKIFNFDKYVLNKIKDPDDLVLIKTSYEPDAENGNYVLKKKLSNKKIDKIREILKKIRFEPRPDIKFRIINVWGHSGWGITTKRVIDNIKNNRYPNDNLFLIAARNYPHRKIFEGVDHTEHTFLQYPLDNDHWVYKLKSFTEEEMVQTDYSFPRINVRYMYFGTNIGQNNERAGTKFNPKKDVMVRIRFDAIERGEEEFHIKFKWYNPEGKMFYQSDEIPVIPPPIDSDRRWGDKMITATCKKSEQLTPGKYKVEALVSDIVIFERSFKIVK